MANVRATLALISLIASVALGQAQSRVAAQPPGQLQSPGQAVQPWRCVASSVAVGPIFRSVVTPGCVSAPTATWPTPTRRMKAAEAVILPLPPAGLAAEVSGTT